jgi:hypothetical protein
MPRGYHLVIHHQLPAYDGTGGSTKVELVRDHWWYGPKSVYTYLSLEKMLDGIYFEELREWLIAYAWELKRNKNVLTED